MGRLLSPVPGAQPPFSARRALVAAAALLAAYTSLFYSFQIPALWVGVRARAAGAGVPGTAV